MKLPSFQFYPGDWRKDPKLSSVSMAAKGLWMDMLCLMFESERRGYLQVNGKAPSKEQLSRMVCCSIGEITPLLLELKDADVYSCTRDGIIYSRRMVRDENIRKKRVEAGEKGGNPAFKIGKSNPYYHRRKDKQKDKQIDKQTDKQGHNQKITSSSSSSSSASTSVINPPKSPLGDCGPPEESAKTTYKMPTDPLGKAVIGWKLVTGNAKDDRAWDKLNWARIAKTAGKLLEFFGGDLTMTVNCMEDTYRYLTAKGLACTIETVAKHASEWKLREVENNATVEVGAN